MAALTLVIGKDAMRLPPPGVGGVATTSPDTAVKRGAETFQTGADIFDKMDETFKRGQTLFRGDSKILEGG